MSSSPKRALLENKEYYAHFRLNPFPEPSLPRKMTKRSQFTISQFIQSRIQECEFEYWTHFHLVKKWKLRMNYITQTVKRRKWKFLRTVNHSPYHQVVQQKQIQKFQTICERHTFPTHKFFTKHYFCIHQLFAFEDINEHFYFHSYLRPQVFEMDMINPNYRNTLHLLSTNLMRLTQTGSLPIFEKLSQLEQIAPVDHYGNIIRSDLQQLERQIRIILLDYISPYIEFDLDIKIKLIQRLKILRSFCRNQSEPVWSVLLNLPVLPPDLRPILQLNNQQIAISDLNKLYQKILFRNRRLERLLQDNLTHNVYEIHYAQRLLQEAVDNLIENGKSGSNLFNNPNSRPLKSLSDILKGKKGRFRQNLLGKRVDYSGRSVIVSGPNLKLYECGIPIEMAIELFQPFLLKHLLNQKKAKTIWSAKRILVMNMHNPKLIAFIQDTIQGYPVLLNRAPTLHRLSIQAFQPKLVDGKAILLHPLVCSAFNADFDGDQMAVHIPLSYEARAEAWRLLWSINNFISPATGQPILMPSQDMILGSYFLTLYKTQIESCYEYWINEPNHRSFDIFQNMSTILSQLCKHNHVHPFEFIWVNWNQLYETEWVKQTLLEIQVDKTGKLIKIYPNLRRHFSNNAVMTNQLVLTTIGRLLFNFFIYY